MTALPNSPTKQPTHGSRCALLLLALALLSVPLAALAQEPGLPYEAGLGQLRTSMTGPVPFMISLVGIIGCGAMLIFGGEISGFLRTMVFIVLVISVIVQAAAVVDMLGGNWTGTPAPGTSIAAGITVSGALH